MIVSILTDPTCHQLHLKIILMEKLILVFMLFSLKCFAAPNVVLLTSVHTPKMLFHSDDYKIEDTLDRIFKKAFKDTDYNIVIKNRINAEELYQIILDPTNIAIFWVSHASAGDLFQNTNSSTKHDPAIVNIFDQDIRLLFQHINPKLRYFSLIGCEGNHLLKLYKAQNLLPKNLVTFAFDTKTNTINGLKKSIIQAQGLLGDLKKKRDIKNKKRAVYKEVPEFETTNEDLIKKFENSNCMMTTTGIQVTITRKLNQDAPAVELVNDKNQLIAFFPRSSSGLQTKTVILNKASLDSSYLRFRNLTLQTVAKKEYLGVLSFSSSENLNWTVIKDIDGIIAGTYENIYLSENNKNYTLTNHEINNCY